MKKTLLCILGPTAVSKTANEIKLAQTPGAEIISTTSK
jgi:tRNA A37 N6-isopentenylltransferase MiaA